MMGKVPKIINFLALSAIVNLAGNANAANLGVSQTPLFLGSSVQPNVFIVNDDSGSMDWTFMTQRYWLSRSYNPDPLLDGSFNSWNDGGRITGGLFAGDVPGWGWQPNFLYFYQDVADVYGNGCGDSMEACNTTPSVFALDWRSRAAGLNAVFYSTDAVYEPWSGPCNTGVDCADASFTAARSNPRSGETGYTTTRNLATNGDGDGGAFIYEVWIDDARFNLADGRPRRGDNFNYEGVADADGIAKPNGIIDLWDTHLRFTVNAGSVVVDRITYDPQTSAGASRGLNETTQNLGTLSTAGACYNILGSAANVAAIHQQGATPVINAVGADGCRTIAEAQTNIANWYQYSRRRLFPVKGAISSVMDAQPNFRYGLTLINQDNVLFKEIPDVSVTNTAPHNLDIKDSLYRHNQGEFGTPLRSALHNAGRYYSDNLGSYDDPIVYSCQKNFTILFTDGFWNGVNPGLSGEDVDSDEDGVPYTLADVAHHFYTTDLSSLEDNVQADTPLEDDLTPDADGRVLQHMVSFTVAFGVKGVLVDDDGNGEPDIRNDGNAWATAGVVTKDGDGSAVQGWGNVSNDAEKIDDLWHAAFNSAGTYAAASTPAEVTEKLINAISNIAERVSSAAAVALNSGTLNANSRIYQASFDSNDWSGSIKSIPIQDGPVDELPLGAPDGNDDSPEECNAHPALGELCDEEWDAAALLRDREASDRDIFTMHSDTNSGVVFKNLADLGVAQQTALRTHPDTLTVEVATVGQLRLDYVRGDNANEGNGSTQFRTRTIVGSGNAKLGDIIHSAPAFVANPDFFYPDKLESASYNAYKNTHKNRRGMVYVGANDGMLHAFDASSSSSNKGQEVFAYIPGKLVDKLPELTSQNYNKSHRYYVDGSPVIFDAFNGSWNTLLAASTGAGGQVVFGLDITDPDSFDQSDVMWEFTDEPRVSGGKTFGDVDLGYTIGDVSYGRMNNGKWVVIFGNGFNNTEADGNASTTGNAAIYVVDAFTGELIRKFDTEVGTAEDPTGQNRPNGISRVTPVDINSDFKIDYLYAGDLFGNLWKMDVRSSNSSSWEPADESSGSPRPFFVAEDSSGDVQSITTAVSVKRHPEKVDETLVLFGTGSYFQVNDATTTQTQTFYGVWDDNTAAQYGRSYLLEQEILALRTVTGVDGEERDFRITSSADVDPAKYKVDWATHKGWYMDLGYGADDGERVNVEPILRGNRVIFVTLTPDPDPCEDGGTSWIMELNANDGSRLNQPPFDVNGDGVIDDLDVVGFGGDDETVTSGVRSKEGIVAKPGILNTQGNKELKFFSGTSGNVETVDESVSLNTKHRQSWRQLR